MKTTDVRDLPVDYALVLQKISQNNGAEDLTQLAESVRVPRPRLEHIIKALRGKGLISTSRNIYNEVWVRLSTKGQKLTTCLTPDLFAAM